MVDRLIVPLDGSPLAEYAVPHAEALARKAGARLILLRASLAPERPENGAHEAGIVAGEEAYLGALAERLRGRGLTVETALLFDEPAAAILAQADAAPGALIVMATHGRGGLGRLVYGSVAEAVLARASAPVLLARAWAPDGGAGLLAERPRLLVALDGSAFAEAALPVAEGLAGAIGGELILLRAVPRPGLDFGPDFLVASLLQEDLAAGEAEAGDYLRGVSERLAGEGRAARTEIRAGTPVEAIAAAGREHGAALVVLTTHGYTGARRMLLGSVADAVLRHGSLPLLLVRPPAQADAAGER